jgi:hypothetical protein
MMVVVNIMNQNVKNDFVINIIIKKYFLYKLVQYMEKPNERKK